MLMTTLWTKCVGQGSGGRDKEIMSLMTKKNYYDAPGFMQNNPKHHYTDSTVNSLIAHFTEKMPSPILKKKSNPINKNEGCLKFD